ncbi:hypothetical protein EVA_02601 [gut metagenome]|uniref:Uncharacterized protein n=1 Tax=gut metagenome TaxID=749906 RepID=J9H0T3_9ZZZZ
MESLRLRSVELGFSFFVGALTIHLSNDRHWYFVV